VRPLIAGGTRVLISHDVEHGLAEADLVLGLRGGRVAILEKAPTPREIRGLYA
jgi:heme exporter protein A